MPDLIDGIDFVNGDVFSYQQANRIKDNWRATAANIPTSPVAGTIISQTTTEKLFHRQASAWMEIMQADNYYLSALAVGGDAFTIDAYQDDVTALTGLLRGAYIQASNGALVATGTVRALELKARAGRPGETGNDVAILEGLSISADAKVYEVTTVMRAIEAILDGGAGASIVKAVGIRIANNFQADVATLSYGLEIYRDSFDYDADIALSSGGLIGGKAGHLRLTNAGVLEIYDAAFADKLFMYHTGSDVYIKWSDGNLILQTDEGANSATVVSILPKGVENAELRIYDRDGVNYFKFYQPASRSIIMAAIGDDLSFNYSNPSNIRCWEAIGSGNPYFYLYGYQTGVGVKYLRQRVSAGGFGYIEAETRLYLTSGTSGMNLNSTTAQDIQCWSGISAGNPFFYIYGFKTADAVKYLRMQINTTGSAVIDAEIAGYIRQGGTNMLSWENPKFRLFDDKVFAFGTDSDVIMGYMNTGDIWHLCDQATLGANIRMSVNGTGLSFFGVAPVAQPGHIADAGVGTEIATINAILVALENLGLVAAA